MKKYVEVRFEFEGMHHWLDAPKEVFFLKNLHRHMFHVRVRIEVFHDDREVEFILLKRELEKMSICSEFYLGERSCEMIAKIFYDYVKEYKGRERDTEVEVSEDGENGAILKS